VFQVCRADCRLFSGRRPRRRRDAFFIIGLFPRRVAIFDRVMKCLQQLVGPLFIFYFFLPLGSRQMQDILSIISSFPYVQHWSIGDGQQIILFCKRYKSQQAYEYCIDGASAPSSLQY
jgi:hypothetical protein